MRARHIILVAGVVLPLLTAISAPAQQATIGNRFHTLSDSFFEQNNISWSGNYRGINFAFGNGLGAPPPFGSPNTAAGLGVNFAIAGKNGQINFALNFAQGDKRADVSQAPSVTVMNGQTGYFSDTSQTPFVIGAIPVVGGFPMMQPAPGLSSNQFDPRVQALLDAQAQAQADAQAPAPAPPVPGNQGAGRAGKNAAPAAPAPVDAADAAAQRLDAAEASTAGRPALSVAEARRLQEKEQAAADGQMAALMVRAQALEEDGQPNVAKIYYQRIAKHGSGELQQRARERLYALQGK